MKTKIFTLVMLAFIGWSTANAQVGIGTTTPDASSILDVTSTEKGFLPPRMTTNERDAIASPAEGLTIYNTNNKCLEFWNSTDWISACDGSIVTTNGVDTFTCGSATFSPSVYQKGVAYTGTLTIPYTGGNGANYSEYVVTSTGNTDFTATLPAGTLASGAGNLVFNVTGTSSDVIFADFAISFGGQTCNATLTTCGAFVAAGVFKEFMCHNLGADESLDPNVPVKGIHGNYYQWGRPDVVANADTPATAITGWNTTSAADGSWLDTSKTANDPCPSGYRVPTNADWDGVTDANLNTKSWTGSFGNSATNFGSAIHFGPDITTKTLTLPAAGYLFGANGTLNARGSNGYYWSSTEDSTTARDLRFSSANANTGSGGTRTNGFSVRCVSE